MTQVVGCGVIVMNGWYFGVIFTYAHIYINAYFLISRCIPHMAGQAKDSAKILEYNIFKLDTITY